MSKNTRTLNATTVPALPSAPNKADPELKKFLDKMVEAVEIRLGRRGDPRDRAITLRELISSGLAKELAANPYDPNALDFGLPLGDDLNLSQAVGKPENLTVTAGFTAVLIKWDLWKHRNHFRTHVYRNTSDVRSAAIFIGTSTSQFYSDEDVTSGTTYYYWARHENTHGDMSEWNAESGTSATVQPDVDFLLTTLTGEIRNSHLYTTLATDVGRIPGWHSIIGSYDPATQRTLTQLDTGVTTLTTQSGNNLTDLTALKTVLGGNTATAFTVLNSHVTDGADATSVASQLTALNTTQGNQQATITSHTGSIGGLEAEYFIKAAVGASGQQRLSGFGFVATAQSTDFGILADKFFIEAPAGSSVTQPAVTPFSVVTSAQTFYTSAVPPVPITLPSGVYMDGAFIKFGSITEAHIGTATIDNAHITNTLNANKIVAGTLDTGRINLDGATIDSNNNGQIQIANLGVTTAKIADADVTTLKIEGDACTVPKGVVGTGGTTIGYDNSETITNWTAIDGGGVTENYSSNLPSQVTVLITQNFVAGAGSSNQADNVIDMAFRISSDGGSTWLTSGATAGRVAHSALEDYAFTLTSGYTFQPTGTGNILVRLYARKLYNQSSWETGRAHFIILGTRR